MSLQPIRNKRRFHDYEAGLDQGTEISMDRCRWAFVLDAKKEGGDGRRERRIQTETEVRERGRDKSWREGRE